MASASAGSRSPSVRGRRARDGARTVVRLVVPDAEEDDEVELTSDRRSRVRRPGLTGPSLSSQSSSSCSEWDRVTRRDRTPKVADAALARHAEAFDGDAVDLVGAGRGISSRQVRWSRAHVVSTRTWIRDDNRSAMVSACSSAPPLMSAP